MFAQSHTTPALSWNNSTSISDGMSKYWKWIILAIVAIVAGYLYWLKNKHPTQRQDIANYDFVDMSEVYRFPLKNAQSKHYVDLNSSQRYSLDEEPESTSERAKENQHIPPSPTIPQDDAASMQHISMPIVQPPIPQQPPQPTPHMLGYSDSGYPIFT